MLLGLMEKFAFNGLRAMLTIMLIRTFGMKDTEAFQFYAVSLMMSFLVPVVAGLLIKKGEQDLSVMKAGSLVFIAGFTLLAISKGKLLESGMAMIVLGSGFIRASVPALLGKSLKPDDNADSAFSLLYVGFNIGTLAGSLLFAAVGEVYGWEFSFVAGALAAGMIAFLLHQFDPFVPWGSKRIWIVALIGLAFLHLTPELPITVIDYVMAAVVFCVPVILVWPLLATKDYRKGLLLLIVLPAIVIFFALYEQAALSLTTFTDSHIDRIFLGMMVPTTMFQGIDPFFNIVLGSILTFVWAKVKLPENFQTSYLKIISGLLLTWFSFQSLLWTVKESGLASPLSLWGFYFIIVLGELMLVPVLLSVVNSSMGKERASFNMSLVFVLIGASMWLAQYLIRVETGSTQDLSFYLGLFQSFSTWAYYAFVVPFLALIMSLWRVRFLSKEKL